MPQTGISITNTFNNESGQVQASQLDVNFAQLASAYNSLLSPGNYYQDTGAVNAIAITVPAPLLVSYGAGLPLQILVGNANTGATTINVNNLGAMQLVYPNGAAAMSAGQLTAGAIVPVQFDGTNFQYLGAVSGSTPTGAANLVYATPNGSSGAASLRALVAADLPTGATFAGRKLANTSRTNTITLTNDPDLVLGVTQTGTYQISALLLFNQNGAGAGIQTYFNFTGTATSGSIIGSGYVASSPAYIFPVASFNHNFFGNGTLSVGGTGDSLTVNGTVTFSTTGVYSLQWAQIASSANATNMLAGTYLALEKIA